MNSQRAACICAEEEKEELWRRDSRLWVTPRLRFRDGRVMEAPLFLPLETANWRRETCGMPCPLRKVKEKRCRGWRLSTPTLVSQTRHVCLEIQFLEQQADPAIHKWNLGEPKHLGDKDFPLAPVSVASQHLTFNKVHFLENLKRDEWIPFSTIVLFHLMETESDPVSSANGHSHGCSRGKGRRMKAWLMKVG